ncbi:OTU domain-containing protein [Glycine soja]
MTSQLRNGSGSSSSSLNSIFLETEDDQTIASILTEDENLRAENKLGKRLSHLDSIPHTPRVNGQIPDVNDATADHERLSERLVTYGLAELQMEGDGNCQFRALADQLFGNPDYHKHVRRQVIKQLKHHKKLYEGYVPMEYKSYLKKMKKLDINQGSGEIMLLYKQLQTVALEKLIESNGKTRLFDAKVCLVTSFRDTCYVEILPTDKSPTRGKY